MRCRFDLWGFDWCLERDADEAANRDKSQTFCTNDGGASLLGTVGRRLGWAALLSDPTATTRSAYIGVQHGIQAYSISAKGRFIEQQTIASEYPAAMAIRNKHLYVVNGVSEFGGLPRGSAEAYAMDVVGGNRACSR
jgi:hypothetical protein